jgi:hypothetical protein
MNEGTLLGRIGSVRGELRFMPYLRLPLSLNYEGSVTESVDIVNVMASARDSRSLERQKKQRRPKLAGCFTGSWLLVQ